MKKIKEIPYDKIDWLTRANPLYFNRPDWMHEESFKSMTSTLTYESFLDIEFTLKLLDLCDMLDKHGMNYCTDIFEEAIVTHKPELLTDVFMRNYLNVR